MNMNKKLTLVLLFVSLSSFAQSVETGSEITKERIAAAKELVKATKLKERYPEIADTIVQMQLASLKATAKSPEEIRKTEIILKEYYDYDFDKEALINAMVKMYAKEFTTDELKKITEYCNSPAIQKFMQTQPKRMKELQTSMIEEMKRRGILMRTLLREQSRTFKKTEE